MKKKILLILLLLCIMPSVNAVVYKEYKIGDEVTFNGSKWNVVESSDSEESKLVLLRQDNVGVSNLEELEYTCGSHHPLRPMDLTNEEEVDYYTSCVVETAQICDTSEDGCESLIMAFSQNWDGALTYDVTDPYNIGYYMEKAVRPIVQKETGLTEFEIGVLTADQYANILYEDNAVLGSKLKDDYLLWKDYCSQPRPLSVLASSDYSISSATSSWLFATEYWWIDATKYLGSCGYSILPVYNEEWLYYMYDYGSSEYYIRPTITIEKEPLYEITKATDGNGTIEVVATADAGELIEFKVKPNKGYELSNLSLTTSKSEPLDFNEVEVEENSDSSVSVFINNFTMPTDDVHIYASFEKVENVPNTVDNIGMYIAILGSSIVLLTLMNIKKKKEI